MYECVVYKYGNGIFNKPNDAKKYRHDTDELFRFNCDDIYEDKKPTNTIIFLRKANVNAPMINLLFTSNSSVNRYIKDNKDELLANFGKLGVDYFLEGLKYSHTDSRAI